MLEIQFTKVNPTQNMTILVESPVSRQDQPRIAAALMDYACVHAEQVGFIEAATDREAWARLQMMGGEFCGNATMSLAAFLVWRRGATSGDEVLVPLEVSGIEELLRCRVLPRDDHYRATVAIPPPRAIEHTALALGEDRYDVSVVRFDGIVHVVVPTEQLREAPREFAPRAAEAWEPLLGEDACGIILFDRDSLRIDPLIHVRSTASTGWERGCGSGSAAVGACLADRAKGLVTADITQPGGTITVQADYAASRVTGITITGKVYIAARGTAYVHN